MSARDDYPDLADIDRSLFGFVTFDVELRAALDEIDALRATLHHDAVVAAGALPDGPTPGISFGEHSTP